MFEKNFFFVFFCDIKFLLIFIFKVFVILISFLYKYVGKYNDVKCKDWRYM